MGRSKKKHINTPRQGVMKCLKHIWPFKRTYTLLKSTDLWRLLHHFRSNSNSVSSLFLPLAETGLLGLLFWTCKAGMFAARSLERGLARAEKGLSPFFFFFFFQILNYLCCFVTNIAVGWSCTLQVPEVCMQCISCAHGTPPWPQETRVLYRAKNTVACQTGLMKHSTVRDLECQQQPMFQAVVFFFFNSLNWLDSSNSNNLNCTILI